VASDKQIEASRINGARSRGPTTDAGKARSAANSTTHGLTAQPDASDDHTYLDWLRDWIAQQKPTNVVEMALVERACRAAWRLDRCARYEDAVIARRARSAADDHVRQQEARVDWIGRRLMAPTPGYGEPRLGPVAEGDDPRSLVAELEATACGADWLLGEWNELRRVLNHVGYWDHARKVLAVRMLGLRPEDVLHDPAISAIFTACHVLGPKTKLLWTACYRVTAIHPAVYDDVARVEALKANLPDEAEALGMLKSIARRSIARLRRRKTKMLNARAAADLAGAADRSRFGDAAATTLLLRYEAASSRDLSRSLTELAKLRKEEALPAKRAAEPSASNPRNEPGASDRPPREGRPATRGKALSVHALERLTEPGDSRVGRHAYVPVSASAGLADRLEDTLTSP
jgi:hypothetical protein